MEVDVNLETILVYTWQYILRQREEMQGAEGGNRKCSKKLLWNLVSASLKFHTLSTVLTILYDIVCNYSSKNITELLLVINTNLPKANPRASDSSSLATW